MNIDVNTEGNYRLHLDFLFELVVKSNGFDYQIKENDLSITLSVSNGKGLDVYKNETSSLDKRRCLEAFFIEVVKKYIDK